MNELLQAGSGPIMANHFVSCGSSMFPPCGTAKAFGGAGLGTFSGNPLRICFYENVSNGSYISRNREIYFNCVHLEYFSSESLKTIGFHAFSAHRAVQKANPHLFCCYFCNVKNTWGKLWSVSFHNHLVAMHHIHNPWRTSSASVGSSVCAFGRGLGVISPRYANRGKTVI